VYSFLCANCRCHVTQFGDGVALLDAANTLCLGCRLLADVHEPETRARAAEFLARIHQRKEFGK
jgi:hypothetical protein